MNRRNFLRLSLLVPVALLTKLQVEPEKFEIISPSETYLKAFEKMPEAFLEGYKMGQKTMEGYAEGVRVYPASIKCWDRALTDEEIREEYMRGSVTYYDDTDWEKVEWDEMPEGLETIELEWSSENCDPIADLEAVQDWMLNKRGIEKPRWIVVGGREGYKEYF